MTRMLVASMVVVATATAYSGQEPAPPQSPAVSSTRDGQDVPTFRGGTDLVTIDVTVLDSRGRPVQGLRPSDVTVAINGQTRRVTAAELVEADVERPAASTTSATGASAAGPAASNLPAGRRILIAVDQQHIPPGSIKPLLN